MIPFDQMEYHPTSEQLVAILRDHTQRDDTAFFRLLVGFYFSLAASQMRCSIDMPSGEIVPVNTYALNIAPSGFGKNKAKGLMEKGVLAGFRQRFMEETYPLMVEQSLPKLALKRAQRKNTDPDEELIRVQKEFEGTGTMLFSFDSGTLPAIKQLRHQLLMANAGSLNLIMDEVGTNLVPNKEVFDGFIEMFDQGETNSKAIKHSSENKRNEEILGQTPANMLMFGAPSRLFDGAKTEEEFMAMLETGYARRCFFAYVRKADHQELTAEEMFALQTSQANRQVVTALSDRLRNLADMVNAHKRLAIQKDTCILLNEYILECRRRGALMDSFQDSQKRELEERHFKVLKLAGAYAFIDDSPEVTSEHIYNAIKLAEDSGEAFQIMLSRDKPWVKLAKYIATRHRNVIHAEMAEDLPFYKGGTAARQEMLNLAIGWGYKNNIIIKKSFEDGIEFLRGESLKETDLSKMVVAYSTHEAYDYANETAPWEKLHKLTQAPGLHWVNHHMNGGHRNEENAIPGFNMVVIDVDGGCSLATAKLLLKDYKALYYTTKRHTDEVNRFRILLPINYELKLDAKDFKEFMGNIFEWLPFKPDSDTSIKTRSKKWLSHDGHYEYVDGELLDALPFIPKTSKNEERKKVFNGQQSMDNLERWFVNNTGDGNRNNQVLRFAMLLVDAGHDFEGVRSRVMAFNDKLADKLDEVEIMMTVMSTVAKKLATREPATA